MAMVGMAMVVMVMAGGAMVGTNISFGSRRRADFVRTSPMNFPTRGTTWESHFSVASCSIKQRTCISCRPVPELVFDLFSKFVFRRKVANAIAIA
jgi:hypothetical protein